MNTNQQNQEFLREAFLTGFQIIDGDLLDVDIDDYLPLSENKQCQVCRDIFLTTDSTEEFCSNQCFLIATDEDQARLWLVFDRAWDDLDGVIEPARAGHIMRYAAQRSNMIRFHG